eukprot:PhF_6_TR33584/c0_g1_i2/m.49014
MSSDSSSSGNISSGSTTILPSAMSDQPIMTTTSTARSNNPGSPSTECQIATSNPGDHVLEDVDPSTQCCKPLPRDIDHGYTMYRHLSKLVCTSTSHRVIRILQIGANTGDNDNDHLHAILKKQNKKVSPHSVNAILVEPVPWLFKRLSKVYAEQQEHGTVHLVQAAVSNQVGKTTFTAPKEGTRGWKAQMGGLVLPPRTEKFVHRNKAYNSFEKIEVDTVTVRSLMETHWGGHTSYADVIVIDTEGGDYIIMKHIFQDRSLLHNVSIIQFEWKHMTEQRRDELMKVLETEYSMCVLKVHYDVLAYKKSSHVLNGRCNSWYHV